ncbi:MAG: hypothetical protein GWO24_15770, partial [Akkermansiaceae bacterium]|nr:hypothetical protein [Akkermansiaceae bacterium]
MAGEAKGAILTVGVLCRFESHPIGRFRVYVTNDADPLSFGIPAHVAETLTTNPSGRGDGQKKRLVKWVG